jgi:hypothetical protein
MMIARNLLSTSMALIVIAFTNSLATADNGVSATAAATAQKKPIKVFILSGQSNMQGHAKLNTLDVIGLDPKTAPMLAAMRNADGTPHVCDDVWISCIGCADEEQTGQLTVGYGAGQRGPKIGPEFTFGIYLHQHLNEPILIIKTAWGGKSLHTDFRSPSAGPYTFRDADLEKWKTEGKDIEKIKSEKAAATGHYYRLMLEHVDKVLADVKRVYPDYDSEAGYELAGFVWFQGWNDMVAGGEYPNRSKPGGYNAYSENLTHFIRDVRKDLDAPKLPFVIGVMGAGGPVDQYPKSKQRYASTHSEFRKAMAAPAELPEFKGNVSAVLTENYWDMELESLRAESKKIEQDVKKLQEQAEFEGDAGAEIAKRKSAAFDERETEILTNGASNAEYHYLGSGKIIGQIGKAFSDSLFEMMQN